MAQKFNAALIGTDVPDVVVLDDIWWFHFALSGVIAPLDDLFGLAGGIQATTSIRCWPTTNSTAGITRCHTRARRRCSTTTSRYGKPPGCRIADRPPGTSSRNGSAPATRRRRRKIGHGWANAQSISWTFEGPNWAFGGAYSDKWTLTFTDPETIAAGNFLRDSVHTNGYAAISNDTANEFATGILASTVASTGALVGITNAARFDFGVAPLPTGSGGVPGCPTGGAGLAIPAKLSDERKFNALKFIAFVTSPASTAYFSQRTGYLAVRKSVARDPSQQQYLADNPRARVAQDQLPHTRPQDYARVFRPGPTASSRPAWNRSG